MSVPPFVSLTVSTLILGFIIYGISQRRKRRIHIPVMLGCFVADLTLLLLVDLSEGALKQVRSESELSFPLQVHLWFSVPMLLAYLLALFTGYHRRHGRLKRTHFINACCFLTLRLGNWITAFFVT